MLILLAALAVNQQEISLRFLTWQTPEISVFWWLFCAFAGGLLLGLLGTTLVSVRLRLKNRNLTKRLGQTEGELDQLRNTTLRE